MTKEEISLYANKYRKTQKGVLIFIGIILTLVAITLALCGTLILISSQEVFSFVIAGILFLLIGVDLFVGIKYILYSRKKINSQEDIECARNYCRIHGIMNKK